MIVKITAIFVLVLLFESQAVPLEEKFGWNELLFSQRIFNDEVNSIQERSGEKNAILTQLEDLLERDTVRQNLYERYLNTFEKQGELSGHPEGSIEEFTKSLFRVATHNLEYRNGEHLWMRGINQFSDLSAEEIRNKYTQDPEQMARTMNAVPTLEAPRRIPKHPGNRNVSDDNIPASKDWRDTGKVTPIKNQLQCQSCTHFATTGQLETTWAYYKNVAAVSLSPQHSQDCSDIPVDHCRTGMWPDKSYALFQQHGSALLSEYPYLGRFQQCQAVGKNFPHKAASFMKAWSSSEDDIVKGVANYSPVYLSINVSRDLLDYRGGIFNGNCAATDGTHSVLAIGYGTASGQPFWIIKNQWATTWGEQGYLRMIRNRNQCGLTAYPRILQV